MSTSKREAEMPAQSRSKHNTPDPDDPRKPDSVKDLDKQSWKFIARKALREFSDDQCTDKAAALTYYAVLAIFPAMLALVSILGVTGQATKAVNTVIGVLKPLVSKSTLDTIQPTLTNAAQSHAAGFTLIIGLLGALWSASGYVGAFGRALNSVYEIQEGRPFWKLRPLMLFITFIAVVLSALVLVMLVVSGPLAASIGNAIGMGSTAVTVWSFVKWPVLLVMVMVIVALLYYATPNVKQPKFRWISVGAAFAIVVWILASVAFALYVSHFSSYSKTYGSLAGVIVTLLWLWITNLALLFGAEIDSELERGRELEAGIPAEEELQLPARDTRNIKKQQQKEQKDIEMGRAIREEAERDGRAGEYADSGRDTSTGRK